MGKLLCFFEIFSELLKKMTCGNELELLSKNLKKETMRYVGHWCLDNNDYYLMFEA